MLDKDHLISVAKRLCSVPQNADVDIETLLWQAIGVVFVCLCISIYFIGQLYRGSKHASYNKKRWDLFDLWPYGEKLIKKPLFTVFLRSIPAILFIFVLWTGFAGRSQTSFAAPFTWLFWWTLLIVFVALGGKVFCAACPWDFFANLIQFNGFKKSISRIHSSLNLKWPEFLHNIYPATALFIILTWLELGYGLTQNSHLTAWIAFLFVILVILSALIFERRSFCRFACPVGRISGVYAQFSPLELRVKNRQVCKTCADMSCVRGTAHSLPCPTFQLPYRLKSNSYCTLCFECVRSCDQDNLSLKLRPLGSDLMEPHHLRHDEISLIVVIFILTFFHGLTMTPVWHEAIAWTRQNIAHSYLTSFSLLMFLILVCLGLATFGYMYVVDCWFFKKNKLTRQLIVAGIPVVLFYHLSHNLMHLFSEITYMIPAINDPFGWGQDLWGWATYQPKPILGYGHLKIMQYSLFVIGFYFSMKILFWRCRSLIQDKTLQQKYFFSYYPMVIIWSMTALWFILQPMEHRLPG